MSIFSLSMKGNRELRMAKTLTVYIYQLYLEIFPDMTKKKLEMQIKRQNINLNILLTS